MIALILMHSSDLSKIFLIIKKKVHDFVVATLIIEANKLLLITSDL